MTLRVSKLKDLIKFAENDFPHKTNTFSYNKNVKNHTIKFNMTSNPEYSKFWKFDLISIISAVWYISFYKNIQSLRNIYKKFYPWLILNFHFKWMFVISLTRLFLFFPSMSSYRTGTVIFPISIWTTPINRINLSANVDI